MKEETSETVGTDLVKVGIDETADQVKAKADAARQTQRTKARVAQDKAQVKTKTGGVKPKGKPKAKPLSPEQAAKAVGKGFATSSGMALFDFVIDYLIENPNGATADEIALLTKQPATSVRGVIRRQAGVSTRKGVRFAEVRDGKQWLFIVEAPTGVGSRNLYKVTKAGKVPPEVQAYL